MAAAQQRTKQSHRMSTGGRDILSRMLLMEKQSKGKRGPSTSPVSHPNGETEYFNDPTTQRFSTSRQDIQPSPSPDSLPTHPAFLPRSETWPVLDPVQGSADTGPAKKPLKIETTRVKDDPAPNEICLSPSWSDHGEKKRKKEKRQREKEQKDLDRKIKQYGGLKRELSKQARKEEEKEKQRAADVIAGKRLSKKPPPAAMETQKMPSGLRRNSFTSFFSSRPSSREGSRRNSQSGDENRLSGISLSSFTTERSQSTPATSDEPANSFDKFRSTVSSTPPQLPSFSWKSRGGSNETSRGVSWVSEDAYDKEVVEFAYRLDASAFIAESERIEKKRSQHERQPRKSHFKEHTEVNGISRSATEPILTRTSQGSATLIAPPRSPKRAETYQQANSANMSAKREETNEPTIRPRNSIFNHVVARDGHTGGELPNRASNKQQTKPPKAMAPQIRPSIQSRPSHDGSSYVQKQRMYQQQMSIASFEDQQIVQDAYELAAENEKAVGAQSNGASTLNDSQSSTPNWKAATPKAHQYDRQDSEETIVTVAPEGQTRRDCSPPSRPSGTGQALKNTPLSQSTNAVGVSDRPNPDGNGANAMQLQDTVTTNNIQPPASSKADKILGFRKRSKPPPSKIWVSEDVKSSSSHQHPMSAPPTQLVEPASKRSKVEKMLIDPISAQISFRKRAGSASSATLIPPSKELFRTHSRNRTNSSEALTADLPSPVPWSGPINTPKPKQSKGKEQSLPMKKELKSSQEKWPELGGSSGKSRGQANEGVEETASNPIGGPPATVSVESKDVNKQHSPVIVEQTTTEVKELTRYELVETIKPRATTKESSLVEVRPTAVSSPSFETSTTTRQDIVAPPKAVQAELEVVLESMNSEGMIRKASITRPRSNPQLQTQTAVANSLPSLDFLPQLKHQPLVKRNSPPRTSIDSAIPQSPPPPPPGSIGSLSSSPANSRLLASTAVDLPAVLPRSPLRQSGHFAPSPNSPPLLQHLAATTPPPPPPPITTRSSSSIPIPIPIPSPSASASTSTLNLNSKPTEAATPTKPIAKLFVICCHCKFWHDLPSKLYEAMAMMALPPPPQDRGKDERDRESGMEMEMKNKEKDGREGGETKSMTELNDPGLGLRLGVGQGSVKCPWCRHDMSTRCCQGWTAVVYLHSRHH